eukprot:TRINITY_DN50262_c0_g1_i1.p1 TRINITY_DN50262_c0_g1~~TRINITY_DN50262_c0_g1_i1.p1  ORF type:complete len:239 (+),score=0.17 TRINITY_DN50262_c0_g1_i1:159-875(+)
MMIGAVVLVTALIETNPDFLSDGGSCAVPQNFTASLESKCGVSRTTCGGLLCRIPARVQYCCYCGGDHLECHLDRGATIQAHVVLGMRVHLSLRARTPEAQPAMNSIVASGAEFGLAYIMGHCRRSGLMNSTHHASAYCSRAPLCGTGVLGNVHPGFLPLLGLGERLQGVRCGRCLLTQTGASRLSAGSWMGEQEACRFVDAAGDGHAAVHQSVTRRPIHVRSTGGGTEMLGLGSRSV